MQMFDVFRAEESREVDKTPKSANSPVCNPPSRHSPLSDPPSLRYPQSAHVVVASDRPFHPLACGPCGSAPPWLIVFCDPMMYVECMARLVSTTVRLDEEDIRALKRARASGFSASDLIRKGLRVVASRYYSGRRPPSTLLFESTNAKLGDESELFRDLKD
jgi:hypothetical protein